ncbi:hypothetical protein CLAIMM_04742 [Cladophialophora immunda]|nr:hypothetical protein CLAIMM_04742 [Cladophialophora immunda]
MPDGNSSHECPSTRCPGRCGRTTFDRVQSFQRPIPERFVARVLYPWPPRNFAPTPRVPAELSSRRGSNFIPTELQSPGDHEEFPISERERRQGLI